MLDLTIITGIYLGIALLFISWNLIIHLKEIIWNKINKKQKYLFKIQIKEEMQKLSKKKNVSKKHLTLLEIKLESMSKLLLFEDILKEIEQKNAPLVKLYCESISTVFQHLANKYRDKDSIEKAYFTHILSLFPELMQNDDNSIHYAMMHFVFDKSSYCRENAMRFFFRKGSIPQIINSLKKISKRNLYYSSKLLSDNLLEFPKDHTALTNALLAEFDAFSVNFQMAIINYVRLKKEKCYEDLYPKLKKHKYDKEVELAIIRYFGTMKYEPAKELLLEIMQNQNIYNYEYRLVSAYALGSYDEPKVQEVLIQSLTDLNWFVRKNSAISLSRMKLTREDYKKINSLNDKYAKEMMNYIWEQQEKKEGIINE